MKIKHLSIALSALLLAAVADASENFPNSSKIFVMEPVILYENAFNEQKIEKVDEKATKMLNEEFSSSNAALFLKFNMSLVRQGALDEQAQALVHDSYQNLRGRSQVLMKRWKDKTEFLEDFGVIKNQTGADLVLVQLVQVKMGTSGYYDFVLTGSMAPGTSTTAIRSALIDLTTGKTEWSGSSIERVLPERYAVRRLLNALYEGFPNSSTKEK
ncbi:MAG TPA: hypothetical protein VD883_01400 [Candidatus Omnitrophota bacterium]|nr:hypothetical protein [Candidatus Omnitrophota bacterium]